MESGVAVTLVKTWNQSGPCSVDQNLLDIMYTDILYRDLIKPNVAMVGLTAAKKFLEAHVQS